MMPAKTPIPQYPVHLPHYRLTAQMRSVLARMARANQPALHTLTPAHARLAYEAGAGVLELPTAALARVEDFDSSARWPNTDGAPVRAEAPTLLPLLLYLHGGGSPLAALPRTTCCAASFGALGRLHGGVACIPAGTRAPFSHRVERCLGCAAMAGGTGGDFGR